MGRRRAAVLLGVHLLIALLVAHWLSSGPTLTPLEPSEAMQFSKHSIINAGLIFFALAILSTLVLGRWFCGWGCHMVALQDLTRWALGKLGISLRPLRSSVLGLVPLLAFLYMFIAPWLYRALGESRPAHGILFVVTTDHFWATFPGWASATLTFLTCGFVIVYLLGAKGFCTYGCPYGAIFGVADQLSPLRIRVNEDCTGSGHCSLNCSSNVRVAEEVRQFGMVVDPGCMKCFDCVSVCPNNALHYGAGVPALLARAKPVAKVGRRNTVERRSDRRGAGHWLQWTLTTTFSFAALCVFVGFDRAYAWTADDLIVAGLLTAGAVATCAALPGKSPRQREQSFAEEATLAVLFIATIITFRGLYGLVAFLFALGLAVVVAYLGLQALRLVARDELAVHGWRMKQQRRLRPAGVAFAGVILAVAAFGVYSGIVQYHDFRARQIEDALARFEPSPDTTGGAANSVDQAAIQRAIQHLRIVEDRSLIPSANCALRRAHLQLLAGRSEQYERELMAARDRYPHSADLRRERAGFYARQGRSEDAVRMLEESIRVAPDDVDAYAELGFLLTALRRFDEADRVYGSALALDPGNPMVLQNLGILHAERGDLRSAVGCFARAVNAAPDVPRVRVAYARALCELGRWDEGIEQYRTALALTPEDASICTALGNAYARTNDIPAATEYHRRAVTLAPRSPDAHLALAELLQAAGDVRAAQLHFETARKLIDEAREPRPHGRGAP